MKLPFKRRSRLTYEFLPAAEEIVESPPSPLGRTILWMIVSLVLIALMWSYLGKIDIVATAPGKITPKGNVKIVQPATGGIIKSINVSEGETVKRGQTLVKFDASFTRTNIAGLEKTLAIARLERDVTSAIANGKNIDAMISAAPVEQHIKDDLLRFARTKMSASSVRQQFLSLNLSTAKDQLAIEQTNLDTLAANVTSAEARERELRQQYDATSILERSLLQPDLDAAAMRAANTRSAFIAQQQRLAGASSAVNEASGVLKNYTAENNSTVSGSVIELDKRTLELENALEKAKQESNLQSLTSPVDGTVLSIANTTIGGVVTTAQPFITIVPSDTPLIVESRLATNDRGFVHTGQSVAIKVDAFSFQRYGYLRGTVKSISTDVIADEKHGTYYKMMIELTSKNSSKDNHIEITPGMSTTNEITTGQRRIIEFFLDPFMTHTDTSLKMR